MGLLHLGVVVILGLAMAALVGARDPAGIETAGPVPGRSGSAHFAVSAKAAAAPGATAACFGDGFVESFVLETTGKGAGTTVKTGYFAHLTGWTRYAPAPGLRLRQIVTIVHTRHTLHSTPHTPYCPPLHTAHHRDRACHYHSSAACLPPTHHRHLLAYLPATAARGPA